MQGDASALTQAKHDFRWDGWLTFDICSGAPLKTRPLPLLLHKRNDPFLPLKQEE